MQVCDDDPPSGAYPDGTRAPRCTRPGPIDCDCSSVLCRVPDQLTCTLLHHPTFWPTHVCHASRIEQMESGEGGSSFVPGDTSSSEDDAAPSGGAFLLALLQVLAVNRILLCCCIRLCLGSLNSLLINVHSAYPAMLDLDFLCLLFGKGWAQVAVLTRARGLAAVLRV
jgi:hypothetical protein